jgi:hypothetical protein
VCRCRRAALSWSNSPERAQMGNCSITAEFGQARGSSLIRRPPLSYVLEDLVDIVVLAAVEMMGSPPATVRPPLHTVLKRGREVGLTMEAAEQGLRAPARETAKTRSRGRAERNAKARRRTDTRPLPTGRD